MSKVVVTTVLPDSGASDLLTIGAASDSVAISGDSLNVDTLQDAGGNTIFVSDGSGTITSKNSGFPAGLKLISDSGVLSGVTNYELTSGIDSTYDVYCFKFIAINPATDIVEFLFEGSTNGGSSYGVTKTTTFFYAYHTEGDSGGISYHASYDRAQSTDPQPIAYDLGSDSDQSCVGELHLFAPSSTTYVKHFYSVANINGAWNRSDESFVGGYFNTTSAIDAVNFKMSSGNFDGIIKMYGISKS